MPSPDWPSQRLEFVAEVIDPHPSHRAPPIFEQGIPFVGIGDVTEDGQIDVSSARSVSPRIAADHKLRYTVAAGDIGFGRVATVGKVIRFGTYAFDFTLSPTLALIKPHSIDRTFLIQYLQSQAFDEAASKLLTGTTRSSLGIQLLRKLEVTAPACPNEQAAIGAVLDTLDTTIRQTEAIIEKLKQVKQGLLHDLLTRGIDANGELRPPQRQAPQIYKDSPLGWIPMPWTIRSLQEVAFVVDPQPDHRTPREAGEGAPYVGIGDFDALGELDVAKCRKVVRSALLKQERSFSIEEGDVIYGKIGTIGMPKLLPKARVALTANVLLIQPRPQSNYVFHYLQTHGFERQLKFIINTTSQPALGIETMRLMKLAVPTSDEMQRITCRLDSVDRRAKLEALELSKLRSAKSGLMDDLLTGRVRVTSLMV